MSISVRALIAHFCCLGIACLLWAGAPTTFCSPEALEKPSGTTLTFAERVGYQRAIEEVRCRNRIWPKENPRPKPPLQAIISAPEIEQNVKDYLRKSQLLADQRGRPISASELQAEMERMAKCTKQPDVLRELFAALANDPFVIAECLARQILAERLIGDPTVVARVSPALRSVFAADTAASTENRISAANLNNATYTLPEIDPCTDDTWTAASVTNAPDAREFHTAIWTGSEMIVWGGFNPNGGHVNSLNTGGRYNPATDSWTATSVANAPLGRSGHTAVWTGNEVIVWGGANYPAGDLNSGGRYNPITDSWIATSTTNAPTARAAHTAVWTGGQMIVWGGRDEVGWFNTGGRYDPNTDSWTATSTINAPERRWAHTVEWTGSEMIVWGGTNQTIYLNTGGRYNPGADSWTPTGLVDAPLGKYAHTAAWTGGEMIVWGGVDSTFNDSNTGGRYNPMDDGWIATSLSNAPSPRDSHTAVWTGMEMVVWGGEVGPPGMSFDTGGRYSVDTDSWVATSIADVPHARDKQTAVWTGSEMIVWGGAYWVDNNRVFLNTGGRYCAQSGPTPTPTVTSTPTATATPTATPAPTATATPTATPSATPTPRTTPTPRSRPTPPPRP